MRRVEVLGVTGLAAGIVLVMTAIRFVAGTPIDLAAADMLAISRQVSETM